MTTRQGGSVKERVNEFNRMKRNEDRNKAMDNQRVEDLIFEHVVQN